MTDIELSNSVLQRIWILIYFIVMLFGFVSNMSAIIVNDGYMPVIIDDYRSDFDTFYNGKHTIHENCDAVKQCHLVDIYYLFGYYISIGDVLLFYGFIGVLLSSLAIIFKKLISKKKKW